MSTYIELSRLGRSIGLEGDILEKFIKDQQNFEREERFEKAEFEKDMRKRNKRMKKLDNEIAKRKARLLDIQSRGKQEVVDADNHSVVKKRKKAKKEGQVRIPIVTQEIKSMEREMDDAMAENSLLPTVRVDDATEKKLAIMEKLDLPASLLTEAEIRLVNERILLECIKNFKTQELEVSEAATVTDGLPREQPPSLESDPAEITLTPHTEGFMEETQSEVCQMNNSVLSADSTDVNFQLGVYADVDEARAAGIVWHLDEDDCTEIDVANKLGAEVSLDPKCENEVGSVSLADCGSTVVQREIDEIGFQQEQCTEWVSTSSNGDHDISFSKDNDVGMIGSIPIEEHTFCQNREHPDVEFGIQTVEVRVADHENDLSEVGNNASEIVEDGGRWTTDGKGATESNVKNGPTRRQHKPYNWFGRRFVQRGCNVCLNWRHNFGSCPYNNTHDKYNTSYDQANSFVYNRGRGTERACYYCGHNHIVKFCPALRQMRRDRNVASGVHHDSSGNNVRKYVGCFICNGLHRAAQCPRRISRELDIPSNWHRQGVVNKHGVAYQPYRLWDTRELGSRDCYMTDRGIQQTRDRPIGRYPSWLRHQVAKGNRGAKVDSTFDKVKNQEYVRISSHGEMCDSYKRYTFGVVDAATQTVRCCSQASQTEIPLATDTVSVRHHVSVATQTTSCTSAEVETHVATIGLSRTEMDIDSHGLKLESPDSDNSSVEWNENMVIDRKYKSIRPRTTTSTSRTKTRVFKQKAQGKRVKGCTEYNMHSNRVHGSEIKTPRKLSLSLLWHLIRVYLMTLISFCTGTHVETMDNSLPYQHKSATVFHSVDRDSLTIDNFVHQLTNLFHLRTHRCHQNLRSRRHVRRKLYRVRFK
ncbi:hypothetical protein BsWGS_27202 [Bradybaena similaris]